ncbi:hypothetical protein LAZ67_2003894 [Cordylochernes scorpioides]|uniref:Transposase n=1 Tax=Cordylochernes scorpioides TaxID=51811 RepID=A0ABY6K504_9ARAC|nr:hypothetical protein LAZ67_2003894 [Cordylochernes scorpioides]
MVGDPEMPSPILNCRRRALFDLMVQARYHYTIALLERYAIAQDDNLFEFFNDSTEPSVPKQETTFEEEETSPPQGTSADPLTQIADALSKLLVARSPREIDVSPYDGTFEAQSFFDNFDAQADQAELTYMDRLRKLPCYLQGFISADIIKQHQPTASLFNIDTNGLHTITRKGVIKIIIPETLQHTLMNKVHQEYNHPGISHMTRIITTQYYWKDLRTHLNPYPEINIAREIASSRTQNKHKKDEETFDKQHRTPHFEVNDLVLVKNYRHPDTADTHLGASTVHRLWRRWLEQGNVAISRNVGATRVTSARVDRRILRQAVAAPQATCTAILQHVQDTLDHSISTRTISRRLVANGLHSCRPLRRLPLTPPNRRQRLEWCRARSTWMTEWHRVVFSDESRFCLSSDSRRGTMTAQRYVDDVLRPVTLPYLQGVPNALYQQDNARPHTARISQQALQDAQMLPWPPYSPDLSPIEHVWDIIGRRLHALPQPRSEDELWQMVEREWRAIPQDAIRTLIDSLPRSVAACIAVRGGPTCY